MVCPKIRVVSILFLFITSQPVMAEEAPHLPYVMDSAVIIDGSLESGEYGETYSDTSTGIDVHWEHNGSHLRVGLFSPGSGWLSIGFGPRGVGMDGANIVIGYVDEGGSLVVLDAVGIGWNHFPDGEKGGEDDILEASGSLHDGRVILEFVFPLASGAGLDHSFRANKTYGFFLAYHETAGDTFTIHTSRTDSLVFFIEPAPQTPTDVDNPWSEAYFYLLAFFALLVMAGFSVWYLRRPKVMKFKRSNGWPEPQSLRS
jgi:hypothetical protein